MRPGSCTSTFCSLFGLLLPLVAPGGAPAQSVAEPKSWTVTPFLGGTLDVDGIL